MEIVRKESEKWDWLQSFQINNSLSGGTGSGLWMKIAEIIKEENILINTTTLYSSTNTIFFILYICLRIVLLVIKFLF